MKRTISIVLTCSHVVTQMQVYAACMEVVGGLQYVILVKQFGNGLLALVAHTLLALRL